MTSVFVCRGFLLHSKAGRERDGGVTGRMRAIHGETVTLEVEGNEPMDTLGEPPVHCFNCFRNHPKQCLVIDPSCSGPHRLDKDRDSTTRNNHVCYEILCGISSVGDAHLVFGLETCYNDK
jgi:hypothetical protein